METSLGRSEALISEKTYSVLGWATRCHLENPIEFQHTLFVCFNFSCLKMGTCNPSICVAPWLVLCPRQGQAQLVCSRLQGASLGDSRGSGKQELSRVGCQTMEWFWGVTHPSPADSLPCSSGELFPGVGTAGSSLLLSDISQCCSSLLAPIVTPRNHTGTWEFPSCSASRWSSCTNQRQGVSRSPQRGWGCQEKVWQGPAGGWGEADRASGESRCFPWLPRWKNFSLPRDMEQSLKGHSSNNCNKTFFYKFDFQQLESIVLFICNSCVWYFRQEGQCQ